MANIRVGDDEPLEKAIKRFKRMVEKENIIREWKKNEFYEKPSIERAREKKAMVRKQAKKNRRLQTTKY